ncbi:MAG: molybdate/tungstate transport system permease protein [Ignavibacteria bacterium]|nr:MAG: molybdate/tungstate transport system permease protein [Ignavibacteria bacterium]KAF0160676.1 MAG: molybdate/tungstate transport system permease protein [Ignavibacteria bacterium]
MYKLNNITPLNLLFTFLGGALLLFIVAPIAGMYLNTSGSELTEAIKAKDVRESIWLSLWTSMAGTLLFSFLAIPLAFILARKDFPLKNIVNGIIDIPIIIPHSAAGIAILGVVTRESWLGKFADLFGIQFVGNPAGIIMAMAFVSIPFLINAARDGFAAVPERLEKVALTLGASPARVFFTISLPLAWRSILSGLILMWGRGMSEFGAVIIVAYNPQTAPILIFERFTSFGLKYSVPAAVIFVSVCLLMFVFLRVTKKKV